MLKKIIFLVLSLLAVTLWTSAQNTENDIQTAFKKAESDIVLLKNDQQLVPIQKLDTPRVAYLSVGLREGSDFEEVLQRYLPMVVVQLPASPSSRNAQVWAEALQKRFDLIILGVNDYDYPYGSPLYYRYQAHVKALLDQVHTITAIFGGTQAFEILPWWENADALLVTPRSPYGQSLTAQAIFGAVGITGKSKISYDEFPAGSGLTTNAINRLRYSPPEAVQMDRALLEDSIKAIVTEGIAAGAFPGAQVLVAKDGHVVYHQAFGYHTFDNNKAVTTRDIYDFASVSKVTSALPAVMKLYGEGKFDLDAPLKRYFPSFKNSNKADLTYREMLAHFARLRPWIPYWRGTLRGNAKYPWKKRWDNEILNDGKFKWFTFKRDSSKRFPIKITDDLWLHRNFKEKRIYKSIKKSPLLEEREYVYSGLLFYLLPEIVADLTNSDYEQYLNDNFYHPLGAYTLTYNPYRHFPLDRIIPTERDTFFRMTQLHGRVHDEGAAMMGGVSANAGLFGSANDLAKLMTMYMNGGQYGGQQLIAEKALDEFTRCQYCDEGNRRGLGFDKPLIEYDPDRSSVAKDASPASFGHSGYTGTFTWADPENDLLFIFFSNRVYPTRDNRKIYQLGIRPRIHQVLYDAVKKGE